MRCMSGMYVFLHSAAKTGNFYMVLPKWKSSTENVALYTFLN